MASKTTGHVRAIGLALAILIVSPVLAEQGPYKVGDLEPIVLTTASPYARGAGDLAQEWTIRHPGATYIRVHFGRFDLAPGDSVEISDADGGQLATYRGTGPHGTGEFWALAVFGDTAVVRLEAEVGGGSGFEIDSFGKGTADFGKPGEPPAPPATPESVCGTQDWKDVECYRSSYPTEFERARGAVKALIGCCSACTAFKVSDSGQYVTNNHCTSTTSGVQSTQLVFEYQNSACGGGSLGQTGSVMGSQMLKTDFTLDYTLFTTIGDSSSIPCLVLDGAAAQQGERIYIAGHPSGGPKKLSIESTSDPGGLCQVNATPCAGNGATSDLCYLCDTTNGSSGSPVLAGDTHTVIGLHHFGGCYNSAGRVDLILPQVAGLLDSCSGGGGGTCGNGTKEPGEACDGGDLGGATCQSVGYGGGTLSCNASCGYDTSQCCRASGASCTNNSQCCSGGCTGKKGRKTCR